MFKFRTPDQATQGVWIEMQGSPASQEPLTIPDGSSAVPSVSSGKDIAGSTTKESKPSLLQQFPTNQFFSQNSLQHAF